MKSLCVSLSRREPDRHRRKAVWLASVLTSAALSACTVAPGMRMNDKAATLQESSGDAHAPKTVITVPIVDINLDLIKTMREADGESFDQVSPALLSQPAAYRLGPGDVIQVMFWDHPELNAVASAGAQTQLANRPYDPVQGFVIDEKGDVQIPYAGHVHVAGLTADQVQRVLYKSLQPPFVNPQLTVRVASYRAKEVYVDGEVRAPGAVPINDIPMTLYEAINRAGGFVPAADQSRMILVRDGVSYRIDLTTMLDRQQNPAAILLRNGDLLHVMSRDDSGVFVMGEVSKPITAVPMKNGRLSLSDALSQAGGIRNDTADAAQMYVIRGSGNLKPPHVFRLDAHSPVALVLANQFELQPKDIVYVDSNGLVRFNRILNLLLPAFNAGLTAAVVTK